MNKTRALFVIIMALAGVSRADINVDFNSGPVANGANFNWTYTAILKSGSTLNTGDFFTIYDVGGLAPGAPVVNNVILPGAGWTFLHSAGRNNWVRAGSAGYIDCFQRDLYFHRITDHCGE